MGGRKKNLMISETVNSVRTKEPLINDDMKSVFHDFEHENFFTLEIFELFRYHNSDQENALETELRFYLYRSHHDYGFLLNVQYFM